MFENIIVSFFDHIEIVLFVVAVFCFIVPMAYTMIKRGRKKVHKDVLNKRTIMIDSGISSKIALTLFLLVFLIVGMIVIYLAIYKSENLYTMIAMIVMGIIFCLVPSIIGFHIIKTAIKVLNKKYVIVLDQLMDIYYYNEVESDFNHDHSGWQLYFKDFFKVYNQYVKIRNIGEGNKYNKGDLFYLVFVKGSRTPYVFAANEYTLDPSERDKLKTLEEAKDYIKLKKFTLETEVYNGKKMINSNTIIHDFFGKDEKRTLLFFGLISIFLLIVCIGISSFSLVASIVVLLVLICILFIAIVKIKYLYSIIRKIKRSQYEIKIDEVISVNENLQYSDSNQITSIKFKNYDKIVYTNKKENYNAQVGDSFYLVFVKGETTPIHVYNTKNSILGR